MLFSSRALTETLRISNTILVRIWFVAFSLKEKWSFSSPSAQRCCYPLPSRRPPPLSPALFQIRPLPPICPRFRQRLLSLFNQHILRSGSDSKKGPKVFLDDAILQCLIHLTSKCKDEELDDLLYFILDIYQFHGIPVAISELDTDMVSHMHKC